MPDPAPITRYLRAKAGSDLLVAAVHHFGVFEQLSEQPLTMAELRKKLQLAERPAMVLFPALCAMKLLQLNSSGQLEITPLGAFLQTGRHANLVGYTGLEKEAAGVLHMVEWLRNDGPADSSQGLSYVKDEQAASPMDDPEAANFFTLALAGRAKLLAPIVAQKINRKNGHLLDVAGGTGYYTYEWLKANPDGSATVFDRPEVLKVAQELLSAFPKAERIRDRVRFVGGDMLSDALPQADLVLAASLFHDWPSNTCKMLAEKFATCLKPAGELWVHDSFLNDALDGPMEVTDYSAILFLGTRGRAYSRKEFRSWFASAGLEPSPENIPTGLDYGLIFARKSA